MLYVYRYIRMQLNSRNDTVMVFKCETTHSGTIRMDQNGRLVPRIRPQYIFKRFEHDSHKLAIVLRRTLH
jgi:hypothetical protein